MQPLRILITNNALDVRAGSELYVRDVALALISRGHTPIVFSPVLGEVAAEIRKASVPVIDDLRMVAQPPDVIHGQHHLETMIALLHFPSVPAVSFCHGWLPWEGMPPRHPRIRRYVAIDHVSRDRLCLERGISTERIEVIPNFVDLERFQPRGPLPIKPRRALVWSSYARPDRIVPEVRAACAGRGITIDAIGRGMGNAIDRPEEILPEYDLVFAAGRSAIEALAVGAAVIPCHTPGSGPLVTSQNLEQLRSMNFGLRTLRQPLRVEQLAREISRYDATDAGEVSRRIRAVAGRDQAIERIISVYASAVADHSQTSATDTNEEHLAVADYLTLIAPRLKENGVLRQHCAQLDRGDALPDLRAAFPSHRRDERSPILGPMLRSVRRALQRWR